MVLCLRYHQNVKNYHLREEHSHGDASFDPSMGEAWTDKAL